MERFWTRVRFPPPPPNSALAARTPHDASLRGFLLPAKRMRPLSFEKAPSHGRAGRNAAGIPATGGDGYSAAPAQASVATGCGQPGCRCAGCDVSAAPCARAHRAIQDSAAAIQRLHFFSAGRAHAHGMRTRCRCALCLRAVPAGVGALRLRQCAALLFRNTGRCGLDRFRIVRIFAAGGVVTGLLELDQLGPDLRAGDRRTRLGKRHDRGNESGSNDNSLNERLHDDLPPDLSVFAVNTLFSADKLKFM
ncbi:hypothetical protein EMIT0111MI5_160091 [Burkholderia sp. IT-111MI5]